MAISAISVESGRVVKIRRELKIIKPTCHLHPVSIPQTIPENGKPHVYYTHVEGGDSSTPLLTDYTKGKLGAARIWHTKEVDKYYQYVQYMVAKKSVVLGCVNGRSKGIKCPKKFTVLPKEPNLIIPKKMKNRNRFFVNHEVALNVEDWIVQENSGLNKHTEFCCKPIDRGNKLIPTNSYLSENWTHYEQNEPKVTLLSKNKTYTIKKLI